MQVLAEHLSRAASDFELVAPVSASAAQKLMHSIGIKRDALDATRERSMRSLAARLDASIRNTTDRLIQLHGLQGEAADTVLERMRAHFAIQERVDETRAALWGSVVTGALAGLKADVVAGGLTLGAGHAGRGCHRWTWRRGNRAWNEPVGRGGSTRSALVV